MKWFSGALENIMVGMRCFALYPELWIFSFVLSLTLLTPLEILAEDGQVLSCPLATRIDSASEMEGGDGSKGYPCPDSSSACYVSRITHFGSMIAPQWAGSQIVPTSIFVE
jgi:hypothetical protein